MPNNGIVEPSEKRQVLCVMRWPVGGVRTYLLYHYPYLQAAGFRFTFVGPDDADFAEFSSQVQDWPGNECVGVPSIKGRYKFRAAIRRLLKTKKFALIHSHGMTAAVAAVFANLTLGVPHVVTSHDVFLPRQISGWKGRMKCQVLDRLLCRASRVIAVSEDARRNHAEYLTRLDRNPGRLISIHNGIDTERFDNTQLNGHSKELRNQLGIPASTQLFGFFGRFMEQKGFVTLLEALERMREKRPEGSFHLVAVGSGEFEKYYLSLVERKRLSQVVSFLPRMNNIAPILSQVDLLVMPSLWEACPLLPMEAMCLGVPVIGSDCLGLREVLAKTPSMILRAGDVNAWEEGLSAHSSDLIKDHAVAYIPEARRRFSATKAAGKLQSVFEEVCCN